MTVSPPDSGEAQHPVLPYLNITNVDVGVLITPEHPAKSKPPETEKEASAEKSTKMFKLPIQVGVPPKAPEKAELSSFQQETLAQPASEGDAILVQQTTAPPQHPEGNYLNSVPIHGEEPTYNDVTVPPLNLELTITQGLLWSLNILLSAVDYRYPRTSWGGISTSRAVQTQPQTLSKVTVPPLDMELTISRP